MRSQRKILLSNSVWMTLGLGIRTVFQATYFILLARAMGPAQYGIFSSTMAVIGILGPYAGWGSGNILVKHVSRNRALFGNYWGGVLAMTGGTSFVLVILASVLTKMFLPNIFNLYLVLSLGVAEFFFARLIYTSAQVFQAVERLDVTAQIYLLFSGLRLLFAVFFIYSPFPLTSSNWAVFYLAGTAISVFPVLFLVRSLLGWGKIKISPFLSEFKEGFYFSVSQSSQGVYNDIDKALLARVAGSGVAGLYAVAYRIIDVAFVPISALLNATYARFFKHGESGLEYSKAFALRLMPWAIGYTVLASIAVFIGAPFITVFLGQGYSETSVILLWLIPLLPLKSIHYLAADSLTGAGFQSFRSGSQVAISVLNLLLNIWLIPIWGWKGAAVASWAADGLLALGLWLLVAGKSKIKIGKLA